MPSRTIRIALLLCDTPLPLVQTDLNYPTYLPIFTSHLLDTLHTFPDQSQVEGVQLEVDGFDVVSKGEYPDEEKLRRGWWDAVMMTGSAHSAYHPHPWLQRLTTYIHRLLTDPPNPKLKIIGICFGMQVIAQALATGSTPSPASALGDEQGGQDQDKKISTPPLPPPPPQQQSGVVPNPQGWEIGVYSVELTEEGREWIARVRGGRAGTGVRGKEETDGVEVKADPVEAKEQDSMEEEQEVLDQVVDHGVIHIQQMHRDHVPYLPPDFYLLGSTPTCAIQGIVRYVPDDTSATSGTTSASTSTTTNSSDHADNNDHADRDNRNNDHDTGLTRSGKKKIGVLGLQGHPEFTSAIVDRMITVRSFTGIIDHHTTMEARRRSGLKEGGEGRGVVGWGVWAVLLDL